MITLRQKLNCIPDSKQRYEYRHQLSELQQLSEPLGFGSDVENPFATDKFDKSLKECTGFRGQLTGHQFQVMVDHVADELANVAKDEYGHIPLAAISATRFGSLLALIVDIYIQTFGIAYAKKQLELYKPELWGYARDLAAELMTMLIRPQVGKNGRKAESLLQLTVRKMLGPAGLTTAIKYWCKSKIKDFVFKKAARGTAINLNLQVPLDLGDTVTSAYIARPKCNQEVIAGLAGDFFDDAADESELEWIMDTLWSALGALQPREKELLTLFLELCKEGFYSNDPRLELPTMFAQMSGLVDESANKLRNTAKNIVKTIRKVLGITNVEKRKVLTWRIKDAATRNLRKKKEAPELSASFLRSEEFLEHEPRSSVVHKKSYKLARYEKHPLADDRMTSWLITELQVQILRDRVYQRKLTAEHLQMALK